MFTCTLTEPPTDIVIFPIRIIMATKTTCNCHCWPLLLFINHHYLLPLSYPIPKASYVIGMSPNCLFTSTPVYLGSYFSASDTQFYLLTKLYNTSTLAKRVYLYLYINTHNTKTTMIIGPIGIFLISNVPKPNGTEMEIKKQPVFFGSSVSLELMFSCSFLIVCLAC